VGQYTDKSKGNFESRNITSPDGMKNYDAVGSAIPV